MATEWPDDGHPETAAYRAAGEPPASGWPTTLAGYAKTLLVAAGTLPPAVVLTWLQSAGVTHLPSWVTPAVTVVLGILAVLFGPKNKA